MVYIGKVEVWRIFMYFFSICLEFCFNWTKSRWDSMEASEPSSIELVLGRWLYYTISAILLTLQLCSSRTTITFFIKRLLIKLGFLSAENNIWSARKIIEFVICGLLTAVISWNICIDPDSWNVFTIIICYIDRRILKAIFRYRSNRELMNMV